MALYNWILDHFIIDPDVARDRHIFKTKICFFIYVSLLAPYWLPIGSALAPYWLPIGSALAPYWLARPDRRSPRVVTSVVQVVAIRQSQCRRQAGGLIPMQVPVQFLAQIAPIL